MTARARRIVVGFDGSDASRRALDAAADLIEYGAALAVVGVRSNGGSDTRDALEQARERLLGRHVSALLAEPTGEPAEAIATAAEALAADLIVVGSGKGAENIVAGLLRQASCDMLVVR